MDEINNTIVDLIKGFFSSLADFSKPEEFVQDPIIEINIPEFIPEITLDSDSETRFGDLPEIQQYEDSLSHAKSEVDADRTLLNKKQAEVDDAYFRLNKLSDQISYETNENLVNSYQSEMSSIEGELPSIERELVQVRADLADDLANEKKMEENLRVEQDRELLLEDNLKLETDKLLLKDDTALLNRELQCDYSLETEAISKL